MNWPAQTATLVAPRPVERYIGHVRSLRGRGAAISLNDVRLYVRDLKGGVPRGAIVQASLPRASAMLER